MRTLLQTDIYRKILIANQNRFLTPIKHPSRTLKEHIISYVCKGSWVLSVGGDRICASADTVFIQPANVPHIGLEKCAPDTHTLFVHFNCAPADRTPWTPSNKATDDFLHLPHLIHVQNHQQIKNLILKIIEAHTQNSKAKASAYLNILLVELAECSESDSSRDMLCRNIKQLIDTSPNENLSNQKIAFHLGVSVRHAEMAFKRHFGTTIHRYQIASKLRKACFFLEYYPAMKIVEIALHLGFYDEYHFSRCFKKEIGVSPTEYRKFHGKP